jgi:hypothetical protein
MTVSDADERLHPVEDTSPHWSDSLYFNAWDPSTSTFLMTRMAVLGNEQRATAGMIVWVGDAPVFGYGHELDSLPESDWDVMTIGALTYRMNRSLSAWAVQLADGDNRAHLEWEGFSGVVDYGDNRAPLPRAVAWGHYEQSCTVRGDLSVGGHRIAFDGYGQRDHSWGFRHWAGLQQWHWITGFGGPEAAAAAFNLFEVLEHDGRTTVNGFVHQRGVDRFVVGTSRRSTVGDHGGPAGYELTLHLDDGGTLEVAGEQAGMAIPVRPAADQPVVVHEVPMRLVVGGTPGYGVYEHLVTEFD